MPVSSNVKVCTHIKVTGVRCGSPALRGEQFCYFHQRMHRGVRTPPQARLHPIALIEDEESIQTALMEVINALMRNTIDLKRAALILRALHIAVKNAARVKISRHADEMVREIPDYAEPQPANAYVASDGTAHVGTAAPTAGVATGTPARLPRAESRGPGGPEVPGHSAVAPENEFAIPPVIVPEPRPPQVERPISAAEIDRRRAEILAEYYGTQPSHVDAAPVSTAHVGSTTDLVGTGHVGTDGVGTGTPARPSGPEVPGRSAVAPEASPTKKKPQAAKETPAPKERKNAAHAARHG